MSKEIRARLRAAKAALSKKEFEEAERLCRVVLEEDAGNYLAYVFLGVASLEQRQHKAALQCYQRATELQPQGELAWKGMADFYEKCPPQTRAEMQAAVHCYQRVLGHIQSDSVKVCSTLRKLLAVQRKVGSVLEEVSLHRPLLEQAGMEGAWEEAVEGLLAEDQLVDHGWEMLDAGVKYLTHSSAVDPCVRSSVHNSYIQQLFQKLKCCSAEGDWAQLRETLQMEAHQFLHSADSGHRIDQLIAVLSVLAFLYLYSLTADQLLAGGLDIPGIARGHLSELCRVSHEEGVSSDLCGVCEAVLCVADGELAQAREAIASKGADSLCEGKLIGACVHLGLHDYSRAEQCAEEGQGMLGALPLPLRQHFSSCFQLFQVEACVGISSAWKLAQLKQLPVAETQCPVSPKGLAVLKELQVAPGGWLVTAASVKAAIVAGNLTEAESMLEQVEGLPEHTVEELLGWILLERNQFEMSLETFSSALRLRPGCARCVFAKGLVWWQCQQASSAYSCFLQAAKMDPHNPEPFVFLGHYQRLVAKNLKRASKCYEKAVLLQPLHACAALCLSDALSSIGEEDRAFSICERMAAMAPTSAKEALVRMGLYWRKKSVYSEAIKCFQRALQRDANDKHCWECLGEAYLSRGSHTSSMKAFHRAVELDPKLIYCHYQIASTKLLLGLLAEAASHFSQVLQIDGNYVPALIGRGEARFALAMASLSKGFDGRAVEHISQALADLTEAAKARPGFSCVWKLIGDCCVCLHQVSPDVARPTVPVLISVVLPSSHQDSVHSSTVDKDALISIGCRCYGQALYLKPSSADLWHDLANSYHCLGKLSMEGSIEQRDSFRKALMAIKKSVSLDPSHHAHWNALGVVSAGVSTSLAQHAFIKSIQIEPNNVVAWTNLGALYLSSGNAKLAHEAFRLAQSLDPAHAEAWIGQALIAERIGHADSMDLFRHCLELTYHPEASVGYGYWVCQTLKTVDPCHLLEVGQLRLVPRVAREVLLARDSLERYAQRHKRDACALNYLGVLLEQEGLRRPAAQVLSRVLQVGDELSPNHLLAVKSNLAKILCTLGRHKESLALQHSMEGGADVQSLSQTALSLLKTMHLDNSIELYRAAAAMATVKQTQSEALVAVAMATLAQGDQSQCKSLLFEAFQTSSANLHAVLALACHGCLHGDLSLLSATLLEVLKLTEWDSESTVALHPSCVAAAMAMKRLLSERDLASQARENLARVLEKLPVLPKDHQHLALLELHDSLGDSADPRAVLLSLQKMLHCQPSDPWLICSMLPLLPTCLLSKYRHAALLTVSEADLLSSADGSSAQQKWLCQFNKWTENNILS